MSNDKPVKDDIGAASEEIHASDCALHNAPALSAGPCNCGVGDPGSEGIEGWRDYRPIG